MNLEAVIEGLLFVVGEDGLTLEQLSDIWEFIERNAVIYPPQYQGDEEENEPLFTKEVCTNIDDDYIFNNIMDTKELEKCNEKNMNEWIRSELIKSCAWKYDTTRYIQLPEPGVMKIPNFEMNKKSILKEYEEFLLRKKQREMENEKKPKEPESTRNRWSDISRYIPYRNTTYKRVKPKEDLEVMDDKEDDKDMDETEENDVDNEGSEDSSSGSNMSSFEDDEDEGGFVEL